MRIRQPHEKRKHRLGAFSQAHSKPQKRQRAKSLSENQPHLPNQESEMADVQWALHEYSTRGRMNQDRTGTDTGSFTPCTSIFKKKIKEGKSKATESETFKTLSDRAREEYNERTLERDLKIGPIKKVKKEMQGPIHHSEKRIKQLKRAFKGADDWPNQLIHLAPQHNLSLDRIIRSVFPQHFGKERSHPVNHAAEKETRERSKSLDSKSTANGSAKHEHPVINKDTIIIGGGIAGATIANITGCHVYEQHHDILMGTSNAHAGRIGLGFHALTDPDTAAYYFKTGIETLAYIYKLCIENEVNFYDIVTPGRTTNPRNRSQNTQAAWYHIHQDSQYKLESITDTLDKTRSLIQAVLDQHSPCIEALCRWDLLYQQQEQRNWTIEDVDLFISRINTEISKCQQQRCFSEHITEQEVDAIHEKINVIKKTAAIAISLHRIKQQWHTFKPKNSHEAWVKNNLLPSTEKELFQLFDKKNLPKDIKNTVNAEIIGISIRVFEPIVNTDQFRTLFKKTLTRDKVHLNTKYWVSPQIDSVNSS